MTRSALRQARASPIIGGGRGRGWVVAMGSLPVGCWAGVRWGARGRRASAARSAGPHRGALALRRRSRRSSLEVATKLGEAVGAVAGVKVALGSRRLLAVGGRLRRVSHEGFSPRGQRDTALRVQPPAALAAGGLFVTARADRDAVFVEGWDPLDLRTSFLIGVMHAPVVEGFSSFTRLGRIHARCWAVAFGVGQLPQSACVRFEAGTLRHATAAAAAIHRLPHDCWFAAAEGVFTTAALLVDGHERARTHLSLGP